MALASFAPQLFQQRRSVWLLFSCSFFSFSSTVLIQVRGKGDLGSVQLKDDLHMLAISYSDVIKGLVIK